MMNNKKPYSPADDAAPGAESPLNQSLFSALTQSDWWIICIPI